ncbi:MAG: DNA/RNA nuclease SfsA [Pseudomonadota bacterium]
MRFPSELSRGVLERRYKRFLADITLENGEEITGHCPNPGSMLGVAPEGAPAWVSLSPSKTRKLPYTLELVKVDGGLVAINTNNPNKIGAEAIEAGLIPELTGYETLKREVKYGENSRIDILLSGGRRDRPAYVEIKNVHLMRAPGLAEFPDSVTKRGAKHLVELANQKAAGDRAVMLFIVQRTDCRSLAPADDLDPEYGRALRAAVAAGVEVLCYDCEVTTNEVRLRRPLPVTL